MNRRSIRLCVAIITLLFLVCTGLALAGQDSGKKLEILCSTFPVFQITQNVALGRDAVNVTLMLPARLGCPHDYALTPQDMQKLSRANALVINGLGMEEFLGAPVKKANPRLAVIDSSAGIKDVLPFVEAGEHGHSHNDHEGANPHLFTSPRLAARMAQNIGAGLSKVDPAGAAIYSANAQAFAAKMDKLAKDFAALGKRLANKCVVAQHGVFDYLARDMGLDIVASVPAHAGEEPSAAEMMEIIRTARRKNAGAVLTEPQTSDKISRTVAREAGIPAVVLDPAASGPEQAGKDYYETVMRANLAVLEKALKKARRPGE